MKGRGRGRGRRLNTLEDRAAGALTTQLPEGCVFALKITTMPETPTPVSVRLPRTGNKIPFLKQGILHWSSTGS